MGNSVYEITKMLGDKNTVQKDMAEAYDSVRNLFKEKYVNKFYEAVSTHQHFVEKNKPKEVGLLNALKPFVDEKQHPQIDKCIDMVMMMNTAKNINAELMHANQQQNKPIRTMSNGSIHEDGVYELDKSCMIHKNTGPTQDNSYSVTNMLLILAMMGFM